MFDKNDIQDAYPLTPMQEGMLFHYLLGKNDRDHIKLMSYEIRGALDTALFEKAFNAILDRYDVLRTIFLHEKVNNPLQVVLKKRTSTMSFEDISELDEGKKLAYIKVKLIRGLIFQRISS
jgi:DTW domain-containing protein YfiP